VSVPRIRISATAMMMNRKSAPSKIASDVVLISILVMVLSIPLVIVNAKVLSKGMAKIAMLLQKGQCGNPILVIQIIIHHDVMHNDTASSEVQKTLQVEYARPFLW